MGRLNKQLDPAQTGYEAEKLESDLRKRLVGQDEAIQQIINIYQTNLAGMSCPGRPIGNFLFFGPDRLRKNANGRSHGGKFGG